MRVEFDHKDLALLRLIVESGSVTSAARRMHVTQPAASQRLANLQDRLGTALFQRVNGRMQATPAGQRLVDAAYVIGEELAAAKDDIDTLLEKSGSKLRITTQCYTCYRWMSAVIADMRARFPDLDIDIVPDATEDPYGALDNDAVDIAIVSHPESTRRYEKELLFSDELYAVMNRHHALAGRKYLNPENFAGEDLVLYTGARHAFLDEVLFPAGVSPGRLLQVRMTEAIVELARAGRGIAVLAGWAYHDQSSKTDLVAVRITRAGIKRTWHAVLGRNCDAEKTSAFVRSVRTIGDAIQQRDWRRKLEKTV